MDFKGEDIYKDRIYIIGSISQQDSIKRTADYYIGTGRYDVRYVKKESNRTFEELVFNCFSNILWADRVYIVPKADGSLGKGVVYEKIFAELLRKRVEIVTIWV